MFKFVMIFFYYFDIIIVIIIFLHIYSKLWQYCIFAVMPIKQFWIWIYIYTFTFSHLADTFIQSDLQMRTMEAIKINKRAMICKSYDKPRLA